MYNNPDGLILLIAIIAIIYFIGFIIMQIISRRIRFKAFKKGYREIKNITRFEIYDLENIDKKILRKKILNLLSYIAIDEVYLFEDEVNDCKYKLKHLEKW